MQAENLSSFVMPYTFISSGATIRWISKQSSRLRSVCVNLLWIDRELIGVIKLKLRISLIFGGILLAALCEWRHNIVLRPQGDDVVVICWRHSIVSRPRGIVNWSHVWSCSDIVLSPLPNTTSESYFTTISKVCLRNNCLSVIVFILIYDYTIIYLK